MPRPEPIDDDEGFSLICKNCDAGLEIVSYDQAVCQGWTAIIADPGLAWTHVGLCPDCRDAESDSERPTQRSDPC